MSDRMAVMMDGHILQLGAPDEIYNDPRDLRVAEFVGAPKINLLPGSLDREGHARCGDLVLSRAATGGTVGSVSIGLRPEHLSLCDRDAPESFSGQVVHKENLGADIYLHIAILNASHRLVVRVTPLQGGGVSFGQTVHVRRLHGQAMVFGKDGKRLDLGSSPASAVAEVA